MKTTLDLPDDLVRQVKIRAVQQDRSMKDLVAEYLRQGLGLKVSEPEVPYVTSSVIIGPNGLPTFVCSPDAPASKMTIEELLALEQAALLEEDLSRAGIAP